MRDRRVLSFQDISCVGQCSLTAALPIISSCGIETAILPAAILSTHTGGHFSESGYTFRDLTDDIPGIIAHWQKEKIMFDCLYTGYLGSARQIDYVYLLKQEMVDADGLVIIDPVMGDNGILYKGFDETFVKSMKKLCGSADIILPNITEASLLTGMKIDYDHQNEREIYELLKRLSELGAKKIILKGIHYQNNQVRVAVFDSETKNLQYCITPQIDKVCHGTGDCYASAFIGALLRGKDTKSAAQIAADFVYESIIKTMDDVHHWYGVKFEKALPMLMKAVSE